jgi:hypothetical protein
LRVLPFELLIAALSAWLHSEQPDDGDVAHIERPLVGAPANGEIRSWAEAAGVVPAASRRGRDVRA